MPLIINMAKNAILILHTIWVYYSATQS